MDIKERDLFKMETKVNEELYIFSESPDRTYFFRLKSIYDNLDEFIEDHGIKEVKKDDDGFYTTGEYRFKIFFGRELILKTKEVVTKFEVK